MWFIYGYHTHLFLRKTYIWREYPWKISWWTEFNAVFYLCWWLQTWLKGSEEAQHQWSLCNCFFRLLHAWMTIGQGPVLFLYWGVFNILRKTGKCWLACLHEIVIKYCVFQSFSTLKWYRFGFFHTQVTESHPSLVNFINLHCAIYPSGDILSTQEARAWVS